MDHALKHRQALIASANTADQTAEQRVDAQIKRYAHDLDVKRIVAINQMGSKWVYHPAYDRSRNAHHSPSFKGSAVLTVFIAGRMARELGRV